MGLAIQVLFGYQPTVDKYLDGAPHVSDCSKHSDSYCAKWPSQSGDATLPKVDNPMSSK